MDSPRAVMVSPSIKTSPTKSWAPSTIRPPSINSDMAVSLLDCVRTDTGRPRGTSPAANEVCPQRRGERISVSVLEEVGLNTTHNAGLFEDALRSSHPNARCLARFIKNLVLIYELKFFVCVNDAAVDNRVGHVSRLSPVGDALEVIRVREKLGVTHVD